MSRWRFRPLARSDFPLLARWLQLPHVARWWADDPQALEEDYGGVVDGTEPAEVFVALRDGAPAGLAQRYALAAYPQYVQELAPLVEIPPHAWSIDYFVLQPRQGWGTGMLAAFVDGMPCVLVPVHQENRASWRVLERVGFVRVASGELAPDNPADSRAHFVYRRDAGVR